jgi:hypothetical protein
MTARTPRRRPARRAGAVAIRLLLASGTVPAIGATVAAVPRALPAQRLPAHWPRPSPAAGAAATPLAAATPRVAALDAPPAIDRAGALRADLLGVVAAGRVLWSSGFDQLVNSPEGWGRTGEAWGRRVLTRSAQLTAIEVTRHGFAAALDRDPLYRACACDGRWARVGHASLGVVTDVDTRGRRRFAWPRVAGATAGAVVLGRLQPGQGAPRTVALRAVTTIASSWFGNLAKEFGVFPGSATPATPDAAPAAPSLPEPRS